MKWVFRGFAGTLDLFFAPAYSAPGYALRSRTWDPQSLEVDLSGQHHIVTGANAGLGQAVTEQLARRKATVHMLCRSSKRGERARTEILTKIPQANLKLHIVDVSDTVSIRAFVERYKKEVGALDCLIHNAGVMLDERCETTEKIETTFATNVLGPFLLTQTLTDLLQAGQGARVIFVSSGGMYTQKLDLEDLQSTREPYDGMVAYAQTKRAEVILSELFATRYREHRVTFNSMHPGWADTPGVKKSLPVFRKFTAFMLRDNWQGADTIIWLAASPEVAAVTGKFWFDRLPRRTHAPFVKSTRSSPEEQSLLWDYCESLCETLLKRSVKS
jgi:dehydrogenase/reductase SDR family member 12